jgi:hypothetical protein
MPTGIYVRTEKAKVNLSKSHHAKTSFKREEWKKLLNLKVILKAVV